MRTVTFQSVFEAILRRHGLDPVADATDHDTARAIAGNINRRTRAAWESWDFSELSKTEERAFRSIWNNTRQFRRAGDDSGFPDEFYYLVDQKYYAVKPTAPSDPPIGTLPTNTTYFSELTSYEPFIDRDQTCKRALGQILGIYNSNPSLNGNYNGCLSYRPSERGVWLNGNFGKTVFVWYLLPPSQFTAIPWIEGKAYTRGERVFYTVDGNCYRCVAPTSSAAPSDANYWTMEPMPESLSDYVEAGAYADCLKEGPFNAGEIVPRMQAAAAAADEAEGYLHHEIDKQLIAGERHYYTKPTWWRWSYNNGRCNGGWCNSQRWGGDRVSLLTDACETTWVYPPSPFIEVIQEVTGIISGTTQLVEGQDYIDVVFGTDQPSADWVLLETSISNTDDSSPINVWPGVVTSKTMAGFRLQLNGTPDSSNYVLNWSIRGVFGYYLSGPTFSQKDVTSGPFTVRLPDDTTLAGTVVITPSDGGAGGTFSPSSVALTAAAPAATFTYTPTTTEARGISTTNNRGLVNPPQIGFTVTEPATGYSLTGPALGQVGVESTNFTVALTPAGGTVSSPVTVTPSDGGDGGTFTPATVALTTIAPSATFTYTPATTGNKTISVTNDGGLSNPGNLTYTSVGLLDGDPVSLWTDSSGNGHDGSQTGSARPTYKTNIINGKPVVRFTSAGASGLNLVSNISGATAYTCLAVLKTTGPAVSGITLAGTQTALTAIVQGTDGNVYFSDRTNYNYHTGTLFDAAFHVATCTMNGSGGGDTLWSDGTSQTLHTPLAGTNTADWSAIGWRPTASAYSDVDIAEIIFYNVILSGTDRANVEKYLGNKYGITVAGGTPVDPSSVTGLTAWWKADSL